MNWPVFPHEAMATRFEIAIAGHDEAYARKAAAAAFRELDRLENELSRYRESSDIACANRLTGGKSLVIGDDALECLLIAADVALATDRAFDPAYASKFAGDSPAGAPAFTLDPGTHTLTSHAVQLHLDLGAVGKGYALDRMADTLGEWGVTAACLNSGGSTVLALAPPAGEGGWPVGLGDGAAHRTLPLVRAALSASGTAVKGEHLIDPRSGAPAPRLNRVWSFAPAAGLADALSTAFFVFADAQVAAFCVAHPEVGAALPGAGGELALHGALCGWREIMK